MGRQPTVNPYILQNSLAKLLSMKTLALAALAWFMNICQHCAKLYLAE